MTAAATKVGLIGGPGSMVVPVSIDLKELRTRLVNADHPVGYLPQWNGKSVFTVLCKTVMNNGGSDLQAVMVIAAFQPEKAAEIALANLKERNGPEWKVVANEKVEFNNNSDLLFRTVRLPDGISFRK